MIALGLIETRGLVAAVEACDAALKAAETVLAQVEYTDPALVCVKLRGEVADVKAAVEAGSAAAQRVGELVSAHVIPRPHEELDVLIQHKPQMTTAGLDVLSFKSEGEDKPKAKKK